MEYEGRKAAKKRQADLDNQSWQPFPTVTFPVRTKQPELGEWVEDNGVMGHYAWNLNEEYLGEPCRISLYLPVGPHAAHSLPCVVFAPGSYDPIAGSAMAEADLDEAVGFAESGFAVLIYETSGFSSISRPRERWGSVIEFMRSEGGAHIARSAMNLLEARAVMVDMNRVYAVGHESSAPLALNLAANDPRIHGVALFAPSTDIEKNLGEPLATVEKQVKIQGLREFVGRISPVNRIKDLHCPILVLGSEETASSDGVAFAAAMTKAGKPVVSEPLQAERSRDFLRSSMVPAMAKWLRSLSPAGAGPKAEPR